MREQRPSALAPCVGGSQNSSDDEVVSDTFPSPMLPVQSAAELFLGYLDFFRARIVAKIEGLSEAEQRRSRLPSGWTPLELVNHLTWVELRWLEWGFEGRPIDNPWGDQRDDRWYVPAGETAEDLISALDAQAARSRAIIETHDLAKAGQPGPRWEGGEPATLERILFHLLQEYARHLGHLDIVAELADGPVGE